MTHNEFWQLVEKSGPRKSGASQQVAALQRLLEDLPPEGIVDFERIRVEIMHESYQAELWNIVFIVEGGCSNDGFDYFRNWLILQGKKTFYRVLADPRKIAKFDQKTCAFSNQDLGSVARRAYQRKTTKVMPYDGPTGPGKLKGKLLSERELKKRFPELWEKFIESE